MHWLVIAFGGALGAISRYAVDRAFISLLGPTVLGTFFINITGSFILGFFVGLLGGRPHWPRELSLLVAAGFLGSYTTFSTLTVATVQLVSAGALSKALLNGLGSLAIGLLAASLGLVIGRWLG